MRRVPLGQQMRQTVRAGWRLVAVTAALLLTALAVLPLALFVNVWPRVSQRVSLRVWPASTALATKRAAAHITARLCAQLILRALGIDVHVYGHPSQASGLLVANHASWLDIVAALATWRCGFVAKREVRTWPVIGALANALGVIWIDRSRLRDVTRVIPQLERALRDGQSVLLFPEGTTTDGETVLAFRSALFQAACRAESPVVPIGIHGTAVSGDAHALRWAGSESLVSNIVRVASLRGARVHLTVTTPLRARRDRKYFACTSRAVIVDALSQHAAPTPRARSAPSGVAKPLLWWPPTAASPSP